MNDRPEMPENWDDHAGWETYFATLTTNEYWFKVATTIPGSFSFDRLGSLIDDFRNRNWLTLWFPGCGFSPLPRTFATFGFTVYATDIAPSAVEYQNNNAAFVQPLLAQVKAQSHRDNSGTLLPQVHDFRMSLGADKVDVVFNIKSIQGLSEPSTRAASRAHFAALRPGGVAFFDTMNVQGERRDQLEDALVESGFYIPLHALNKWYRKALADTGIPHMFILGTPMIPDRDDYPYPHKRDSPEFDRDLGILRDITADFRSRMKATYEEEQLSVNESTKHAQVIYSTG